MDRRKEKEKSRYVDKLDAEPRCRYLEKINLLGGFDPYECTPQNWSKDISMLPPVTHGDIVNYMVFGRSAYTLEQFKCYKSLDAHMQFTHGWVHELKIFVAQNVGNIVVQSKVLHSQKLNEKALLPWIIFNKEGTVIAAHCNCMAGLAETCTHVGALLFKIEAMVRIQGKPTVTGVPAYWMIPAGIDKVQHEVGYRIDYTSATTKKKQLDRVINSDEAPPQQGRTGCSSRMTTVPPTQQETEDLLKDLYMTGDRGVALSITPQYCKEYKDPVRPVIMPRSLRNLRNQKCDDLKKTELLTHCESLYDRVCVSPEEAVKIEIETREQYKSPLWFAVRAGRITASQMHSVCTFKAEKPAMTTINKVCYPGKKVNVPAVQWGIQNEDAARAAYLEDGKMNHFNFTVEKSGFIINPDIPYIGASPDGIVSCDCCGRGCVEIKCPYKHKDLRVVEAVLSKDFCLSISAEGKFNLKKEHSYYYQVQCQLLVSKADYCRLQKMKRAYSLIRSLPSVFCFLLEGGLFLFACHLCQHH